jgi:hypothetical protein
MARIAARTAAVASGRAGAPAALDSTAARALRVAVRTLLRMERLRTRRFSLVFIRLMADRVLATVMLLLGVMNFGVMFFEPTPDVTGRC